MPRLKSDIQRIPGLSSTLPVAFQIVFEVLNNIMLG